MSLEGLRVNQLSLARNLQGEVALTPPRLLIKAGGSRPDEVITADLALDPLALPGAPVKGPDGKVQPRLYFPPGWKQEQEVQGKQQWQGQEKSSGRGRTVEGNGDAAAAAEGEQKAHSGPEDEDVQTAAAAAGDGWRPPYVSPVDSYAAGAGSEADQQVSSRRAAGILWAQAVRVNTGIYRGGGYDQLMRLPQPHRGGGYDQLMRLPQPHMAQLTHA